MLAVEQIVQRLEDRFRLLTGGSRTLLPQQQTLQAAVKILDRAAVLAWRRASPAGGARRVYLLLLTSGLGGMSGAQPKAAEIAGLSRAEFLTALARFGVSPFQYGADEIAQEIAGG